MDAGAADQESERLFVALTLPEPVRTVLTALAQPLPGVSWTRPGQLHLTLRFIGDVPRKKIETVVAKLDRVKVAPFVLPVEGCGTFPQGVAAPPRVLWIGVGSGHPRLFQLRQRLDDALLSCGLDLDVRTFHPHATLARCREDAGPAIAAWQRRHREFAAPPFRVEAFDLYESRLQTGGAVHTLIKRFSLTN